VLAVAAALEFAMYWNEAPLRRVFHSVANVSGYILTAKEEQMLRPGDSFSECIRTEEDYSRHCPEMVVVGQGKFMMGAPEGEDWSYADEGPQHEVTIAQPFAVSRFELTFDQWDACVRLGGCNPIGGSRSPWGSGKHPITDVSWDDAQHYAQWLSQLTGRRYRLLSEAEWEYAARGGTSSRYPFEGDASALDEYAWYSNNSNGKPHAVGDRKRNPFGLHDMFGNVWEWVEDCFHRNYEGAPTDGSAWSHDCVSHVVRGGSWKEPARHLRSTMRGGFYRRHPELGFRVARTLASSQPSPVMPRVSGAPSNQ
jgi:formylglycine-generating enzyme required for sulfatase activity